MHTCEDFLVVDDIEDNLDLISRFLKKAGFRVETASGGLEALEKLDQLPIDLMILDIMMPGVSGLDVLERIRKTRSPAELPIVMATAKDGTDDVVAALDLGANDFQNFPIILSASTDGTLLNMAIEFSGTPSTSYVIEIFSNESCDPSGYGEGRLLVSTIPFITDGSGNWANSGMAFALVFSVGPDKYLAVTITDLSLFNTSEFSPCFNITSEACGPGTGNCYDATGGFVTCEHATSQVSRTAFRSRSLSLSEQHPSSTAGGWALREGVARSSDSRFGRVHGLRSRPCGALRRRDGPDQNRRGTAVESGPAPPG
ncbi:MAG: response regulator [Chloroflexi bacterium]|nr:response regulator [Chloroflexota bacterium]